MVSMYKFKKKKKVVVVRFTHAEIQTFVAGSVITTHLHVVPTLRMCGASPPLPLYAFTACA
jgi:hypothetical protein